MQHNECFVVQWPQDTLPPSLPQLATAYPRFCNLTQIFINTNIYAISINLILVASHHQENLNLYQKVHLQNPLIYFYQRFEFDHKQQLPVY